VRTRAAARCSAILGVVLHATPAHPLDQVVTNCATEADLRAKLDAVQKAGGGTITFSCGTATVPLQNPLAITEPTTIDGGGTITLSGGGDRRILTVAVGATALLEQLVLTEAKGANGGAILSDGNLMLRETTVTASEATQDGGAIWTTGNVSILDGSVLTQNDAGGGGGAIFATLGALVTIEDSEVSHNTSDGTFDGTGGAIELLEGADLSINASSVTNNLARIGGAISAIGAGSTVSVDGAVVADNDTIDGPGGAISVSGGSLAVVASTLAGNDAINGSGGAVWVTGSSSGYILASVLYSNTSTMMGGGVAIASSSNFIVENATFSQNGALIGGGFHSSESSARIEHATFARNVATLAGASIANSAASGVLTVRNTIVTDPFSAQNCSDDATETTVSLGGNLSSDASCVALFDQPTDLHQTDPLLADDLADNGGPTLTYLPQPGSPAVDAGVDSDVATDQRGIERPQGPAFDIGAVEVASCGDVLCGDANASGSVSASDALAALRTSVGAQSCELSRCDYDGSGTVQASDALAILRASVGQPVDPACPPAWDCRDE
jgi:fibronectin-binding autotransporter adhesin